MDYELFVVSPRDKKYISDMCIGTRRIDKRLVKKISNRISKKRNSVREWAMFNPQIDLGRFEEEIKDLEFKIDLLRGVLEDNALKKRALFISEGIC